MGNSGHSYTRWPQTPAKTSGGNAQKKNGLIQIPKHRMVRKNCPEEMIYLETGYAKTEGDINFLRLIRKLPEDQREVVYLKYAQELSFREIAGDTRDSGKNGSVETQDRIKEIKKKGGKAGCITDREERKKRIYIKH